MPLLPLLLLALSPIQIDGSFQDWPEGVHVQEDAQFLYALIETQSEVCLQQLPSELVVELGDYNIYFSPKKTGYGVACKKGADWISPYEAGVVFAPTTASVRFEIRVKNKTSSPKKCAIDLQKTGDFRALSWNVQFGNLFDEATRSSRILKAINPDVLLLQELDGDDHPEKVKKFLQETLGGNWTVHMTAEHGTHRHEQLRSAIATNHTVLRSSPIDPETGKHCKALISAIAIQKKPINFISLHLRCCGGPDSEAELQRIEEAEAIHRAVASRQSPRFLIAGDWNLVGTKKPLELVQANVLATVDAYQPDGLLNATWSDTSSSFTPGRLDWMLYSPNTLEVTHCVVLDTADLDADSLLNYDLLQEDTAELSDHLPLIADFKIIR
ncbi:MAG: endonuclease/exonuclease/phosphatase family protein [Phycisphaerales bacterium]|jgi:endonuclease/exonuclease/phosphatase family metal-dependent hydrolase|nr:endonuclease/exonuclease/phosphatase family protein [Phycisphaerales bacterium]